MMPEVRRLLAAAFDLVSAFKIGLLASGGAVSSRLVFFLANIEDASPFAWDSSMIILSSSLFFLSLRCSVSVLLLI